MGALPPIKRLVKEDFPDQPWIGKLLQPLNEFFESVYSTLNRNTNLDQNVSCQLRDITVVGGSFPIYFTVDLPSKPRHLLVTRVVENVANPAPITTAVWAHWDIYNGQIRIRNISGLTPGANYTIGLIVYP